MLAVSMLLQTLMRVKKYSEELLDIPKHLIFPNIWLFVIVGQDIHMFSSKSFEIKQQYIVDI